MIATNLCAGAKAGQKRAALKATSNGDLRRTLPGEPITMSISEAMLPGMTIHVAYSVAIEFHDATSAASEVLTEDGAWHEKAADYPLFFIYPPQQFTPIKIEPQEHRHGFQE